MLFEKPLKIVNDVEIEDTYCEAFDGLFTRFMVTARTDRLLARAALGLGLPSVVVGRTEGGVEKYLSSKETPDGNPGFLAQVWGMDSGDLERDLKRFYKELCLRLRQGILVVPTTKIYDAVENPLGTFDMMDGVGYCGDKYSKLISLNGRDLIQVPIMMGEDFYIEKTLGYARAISGGNIWYFCKDVDSAITVGERVIEEILKMEGVITPFDICSAGSKPPYEGQPNVKIIGPSTNHQYCPSLRNQISDSKIPLGINSIPEIVFDAMNLECMKQAMKKSIEIGTSVPGVRGISTGNYEGTLGKHKIYLRDLV
ncbi:MAG: formylmethanofuran--tetrahydromethanopterin N-formyltransferase [Candidatus Helarchaeota archaeon]